MSNLQQSIAQGVDQARGFISASRVKDIIIGILVGIIAFYLLVSCLIASDRPGLMQTLGRYSDNGNFFLVLILAVGFGALAFWIANRKTPKTQ